MMTTTNHKNKPTVTELLSKSRDTIITVLGPIYEHSSWVAEALVDQRLKCSSEPIETISELALVMKSIVNTSSSEQKMNLLCAHPDLCEKVSKLSQLTSESQTEQGRAGLQSMTEDEITRFTQLNTSYRTKFQFPFILAVRNSTKYTVLAALEGRVNHSYEQEVVTALEQVHKIAWMRLLAALNVDSSKGFLTCHVLDTGNGCPANKMRIQLHRLSPPESAGLVGDFITNEDGRLEGGPALQGGANMIVGMYEWTFYVADYFASKGTYTSGTPFLDVLPLRFGIDNPDDHYHVPLLVSPWSYSTYRGS